MRMDTENTRKIMDSTKKTLLKEGVDDGSAQEAVMTYINGNISDFKQYLRTCSKLDICDVIEGLRANGYKIHNIIDTLRRYLPQQ